MGIDPVTVLRVSKCPVVDGRQNVGVEGMVWGWPKTLCNGPTVARA